MMPVHIFVQPQIYDLIMTLPYSYLPQPPSKKKKKREKKNYQYTVQLEYCNHSN